MAGRVPESLQGARSARAFALLGGAAAWTFHFGWLALVSEWGPQGNWDAAHWFGMSLIGWNIVAATSLAVVWAALALVVSWRLLRHTTRVFMSKRGDDVWRFWARLSVLANSVFIFIILAETLPAWLLLR